MKISFVTTVFNKELSILEFYDKILFFLNFLKKYTYEIIFVHNISIDNKFSLINDICNENKNVKAMRLSRNLRVNSKTSN